jgi:ribonuclease PH
VAHNRRVKNTSSSGRTGGRAALSLRPVSIVCDAVSHAEGSCVITQGRTQVLVTATVEARVPPFLQKSGLGWITAEYGMLPRATHERTAREAARGKQSGRSLEIQRLIGRALRGVADRSILADRTITLDCDVLVADAGTRCASVTGAYVALMLAAGGLYKAKAIRGNPLREAVAAVSVGVASGPEAGQRTVLLDLDYSEDSAAEVDFNVVGTSSGRMVEVQGTAEKEPFDEEMLAAILATARRGLSELFRVQRAALEGRVPDAWLPDLPQARVKNLRKTSARSSGSSSRA